MLKVKISFILNLLFYVTMFKKFLISFFLIFSFYNHSFAAVKNGDLAPQINMTAASGNQIKLNDYLGKIIVLEWKNHDCPFVRKHYDTGNMQMLQKYVTENNGIWLSIISSAPNKQGNVSDNEALSIANSQGSFANEIIPALLEERALAKSVDLKEILDGFIFKYVRKKTLAEIGNEYVFEIIDKPFSPDRHYYPRKSVFGILGLLFGVVISFFYVIIFFREK